ncbi:MAG: hypothetical protein ACXWJK_06805 [Burkholderiaceae bacterium]
MDKFSVRDLYFWLLPPDQAILIAFYLLFVGWSAYLGCRYILRMHRTSWWDRSQQIPQGRLEWDDVKEIAEKDPINLSVKWRWMWRKVLLWEIPAFLILTIAYIQGWKLLRLYGNHQHLAQIKDVGVAVGGFGILLTFVGVLHTVRSNTRSANRQAWIKDVRSVLAALIVHIPEHDANDQAVDKARKKYLSLHGSIELMLNPSEREHRALLAMIRWFYRFGGMADPIEIDDQPLEKLGLGVRRATEFGKDDYSGRKSQLIRLANTVLKREWEQVKKVR